MRLFFSVLILSLLAEQAASAQSLADVARREAERRKHATTAGRVFTNADLGQVDLVPPQTPPPPSPEPASGSEPAKSAEATGPEGKKGDGEAADAPAKPREKRDEPYWRARAQDLRQRLAKANADAAAAESRLSEMDALPASPSAARERELTAAAVAKLQADAKARLEELNQFEAFAQAQKVPPDWTR